MCIYIYIYAAQGLLDAPRAASQWIWPKSSSGSDCLSARMARLPQGPDWKSSTGSCQCQESAWSTPRRNHRQHCRRTAGLGRLSLSVVRDLLGLVSTAADAALGHGCGAGNPAALASPCQRICHTSFSPTSPGGGPSRGRSNACRPLCLEAAALRAHGRPRCGAAEVEHPPPEWRERFESSVRIRRRRRRFRRCPVALWW